MREHPVISGYRDRDSAGAVQLGAALAAAVGQPLVVATAYRYEPVALSAVASPASGNDARLDVAEAQAERAERLVRDGIDVRRRVVPALGIASAIADLARELDACALVVGRDVDARVTRTLVVQAPCPVGVALPRGPARVADPPGVIGAAYDGSPGARFALGGAIRLAALTGARLELFSVGREAGEEHLEADASGARSLGVPIEVHRLAGEPGAMLVEVSAGVDLLWCGSRGLGRVLSAVLGSVSGRLIQAARCPVLVVPPRIRHSDAAPLRLTKAAG